MLAVSGTIFIFICCMQMSFAPFSLLGEIPKARYHTQLGFYPGWNTLQPMFILMHLKYTVHCTLHRTCSVRMLPAPRLMAINPNNLFRLHTAFIDFKYLKPVNRQTTLSPGRLSGLTSVTYAYLYHFSLPCKTYTLAISTPPTSQAYIC